MCVTIFLLADRKLPAPADTAAAAFPDLTLDPVDADGQAELLEALRRIAPAAFAYGVRPGEYFGCYFRHETEATFLEQMAERAADPTVKYANTPEQAEAMWQSQTRALKSFARYLSAHADAALAVYVVWEHC